MIQSQWLYEKSQAHCEHECIIRKGKTMGGHTRILIAAVCLVVLGNTPAIQAQRASTANHWVQDRSSPSQPALPPEPKEVPTITHWVGDNGSARLASNHTSSDASTGVSATISDSSSWEQSSPPSLAPMVDNSDTNLHGCAGSCGASCDGGCGAGCAAGCDAGCDALGCDASGCTSSGCGGGCGSLCACERFWIRAEYLLWWVDGMNTPPLVTSSDPTTTAAGDVGVLGQLGTNLLYGGSDLSDGVRSGGRLRFGYWLGDDCCLGITGSLWGLGGDDDEFTLSSSGDPALARPFFNVDPLVNGPDAELIAYPNLLDGTISARASSELYSGSLLLRGLLCCHENACQTVSERVSLVGGYRFFRMNESLDITENLVVTATGGLVAQGTTFDIQDSFRTSNEFHGSEFGLSYERQRDIWSVELLGSVAFGQMCRQVSINGTTTTTVPTLAPDTRSGGLLAQSTNIGDYEDCEFVALPQLQANLGCRLTDRCRATVGYTFFYVGEVARPGDQIDTTVNGELLDPSLTPTGPSRPAFNLADTDLWITGLNLGLEYAY